MSSADLLPNRLNFDATVFCGCTMKELQWITTGSLSICILMLGICMKLLINMFLVGVAIAFPMSVGITWVIAAFFQRVKQGRPKGYLKQQWLLWCEDKKIIPTVYISRSGKWSIGRMR